jgi:hypothetical protein
MQVRITHTVTADQFLRASAEVFDRNGCGPYRGFRRDSIMHAIRCELQSSGELFAFGGAETTEEYWTRFNRNDWEQHREMIRKFTCKKFPSYRSWLQEAI